MIKKLYISLLCLMVFLFVKGQYRINEFSSKIQFKCLDTTEWIIITDQSPRLNSKGVLMFKHIPIKDSIGRRVEPVIALVYEKVIDSLDVIEYSVGIIGTKPFKVKYELLGGFPDFSLDRFSVVYKGEYLRENIKHLVMLGYILNENIGIEIIGDSTEEIFPKVEYDIKNFIKSVKIKK